MKLFTEAERLELTSHCLDLNTQALRIIIRGLRASNAFTEELSHYIQLYQRCHPASNDIQALVQAGNAVHALHSKITELRTSVKRDFEIIHSGIFTRTAQALTLMIEIEEKLKAIDPALDSATSTMEKVHNITKKWGGHQQTSQSKNAQ